MYIQSSIYNTQLKHPVVSATGDDFRMRCSAVRLLGWLQTQFRRGS